MDGNQILDANANKEKPVNLLLLSLLLFGSGGLVGASMNMVNGWVSKRYFEKIMGWEFDGIWMGAILQGMVEGLAYGLLFSLVYTIGFARITKRRAGWGFVAKILKFVLFVIYSCWAVGGIIAVILAFTFPTEYDQIIYGVPIATFPRMGYAWVGGSIWGGMIGGLLAVILGLIKTKQLWQGSVNRTGAN